MAAPGTQAAPTTRGDRDGHTRMDENEQQIRTLIERWVRAVHVGDLDTVLADHAEDIVMFGREEREADTDRRLRLSIGLRKDGDRWIVAHEHHSFPAV